MRNRQALALRLMAWKVQQISAYGCAGCGTVLPYASAYQIAHTPTGALRKATDHRTGRAVNPTDLPRVAGITWGDIEYEVTHYARVLCATCHAVETAIQQGHAGLFRDIDTMRAFASECADLADEFPTLLEWALWAEDYLRDCE